MLRPNLDLSDVYIIDKDKIKKMEKFFNEHNLTYNCQCQLIDRVEKEIQIDNI